MDLSELALATLGLVLAAVMLYIHPVGSDSDPLAVGFAAWTIFYVLGS